MEKKKLLSKIVCLGLSMSLLLTTPICAADNTNSTTFKTDASVQVITQDAFNSAFTNSTTWARNRRSSTSIEQVQYTYELTESLTDSDCATLSIYTILHIDGSKYPIQLEGVINRYSLSNDILWEGPAQGTVLIQNVTYLVNASFAKLESSDAVQITLTIQSYENDSTVEPIIISFGDDVITKEIYDELFASTPSYIDETTISYASSSSRAAFFPIQKPYDDPEYLTLATKYKSFNGVIMSGYSQRLVSYFDYDTNRIAGVVRAYPTNVNNYFKSFSSATTLVQSVTVSLTRNSYTTSQYSWIAGIEQADFNDSDFGKIDIPLLPLFEDIMGVLGIPSSTISSVLDGLRGTAEKSVGSNKSSVTISNISNTKAYVEEGLPIVFQMDHNAADYTGNSNYTMTSSVKYCTIYLVHGSEVFLISYTDSGELSNSLTFTLK